MEVGQNAYVFAIWFTEPSPRTVAWMANRDYPVNGNHSKLELTKAGNLNLVDAGRAIIWSSNTGSSSDVQLELLNSGNLVLSNPSSNVPIWQSFNCPTDTLLPNQLLTKEAPLVSSVSATNYSSGYYKLYFDTDKVLRLLYNGPEVSSIYWPDPEFLPWQVNRYSNNDSKVASFDSLGHFKSSDLLQFRAADYGANSLRRLTLDVDGNLRMYSLKENGLWEVTWQAFQDQCSIHGLCGPNSLCIYEPSLGRKCSCLPGFRLKDHSDWSQGCEPLFSFKANEDEFDFVGFPHVNFYGYVEFYQLDYKQCQDSTVEKCRDICLELKNCVAFVLKWNSDANSYDCFPKARLLDGYLSPAYPATLYLKVPKNFNISPIYTDQQKLPKLNCSKKATIELRREYPSKKSDIDNILKFFVWFLGGVGIVEVICIALTLCFLSRERVESIENMQRYALAAEFRNFRYSELKRATSNFNKELIIGRGGSGVVYKGNLGNGRVAAIKKLDDAIEGEEEFLAEVNTIGRVNHMNLIETWGYCAEGKHRLLVFEFMKNKSLAERLSSRITLAWGKRYAIALGAARGLAYLHEECLEWVLHCDVKPQNILLDANYNPKVADFGLSKLLNRNGDTNHPSFSHIRGTRGYMAPEWVTNEPITSKVDVYSYGVVMLEIITGKNAGKIDLVMWARKIRKRAMSVESWAKAMADPRLEGEYKEEEMKTLAEIALQCVEDAKDARPTMSQVVEMLDCPRN